MVTWNKNSPIPVHLVCWFLKCLCSPLPSPVRPLPIYRDSWTKHSKFLYNIVPYSIVLYFHWQSHHNWLFFVCLFFVFDFVFVFLLWLHLFICSRAISPLFSSNVLGTYWPGKFIFQFDIFLPFYTAYWVLNARILQWFCFSLLQWTTLCQNSPPWLVQLEWPYMAGLIVSLN